MSNSTGEALCIEQHPDFRPEAKHVVNLLLENPGYYAYFFFHSGAWAQKHVRAESTYQWSEDDPAITWPMFIWDENDCLDTRYPKSSWNDGIWSFETNDDYVEFLKEFDNGNCEYVMEQAVGKWRSSNNGPFVTHIGEEVNCGAGLFNTGPAEVLAQAIEKLDSNGHFEQFLEQFSLPFSQKKLSLSLIPNKSKILWVPLSYPGSFSLSGQELLAKQNENLPEVELWHSTVEEPTEPVYISSSVDLQNFLSELISSATTSSLITLRAKLRFQGLKNQILKAISSGELFTGLDSKGLKLAIIPFGGRSFCVSD